MNRPVHQRARMYLHKYRGSRAQY